ncbi:MAG: NADH-quinone oxidoreductase subunit N [Cytophagaceae bacterium]|nr:NADH-quinone oxidoreductase subunit N [Cytophagaceae bacterium]
MNALIATSVLGLFAMISEIIGLKKWIWLISTIGIAGILGLTVYEAIAMNGTQEVFYGMMRQDNFSSIFSGLLLFITLLWFLLAKDHYREGNHANPSDQSALIIFATVGGLILTSYTNLTMLFLGIEIVSIPMFILAGSDKKNILSNESSLKYFIMGAFATGIMLFGIALLYGATGSFDLAGISNGLQMTFQNPNMIFLVLIGITFLMVGLAFKVSAAPFHFWVPDVYEGAPTVITAFMSTFVKTAAFVAFLRLFGYGFSHYGESWMKLFENYPIWWYQLLFLAAITILVGNIIAVSQNNLKRTLAYSGIAQAGYVLLTIIVPTADTTSALFIYTASYSIATLVAFTALYHVQKAKNDYSFDAFRGLGKSNPGIAVVLTLAMLSLGGIPPTLGFFAKFYLFKSILALQPEFIFIILLAILGSLISLYYYFKVIISMFGGEETSTKVEINLSDRIILYAVAALIIILGLIPGILLELGSMII